MDYHTTYDEERKTWNGPAEVPYYDFNCSVGLVLYENMKNEPKKICQISDDDNRSVTNEEALQWSIRIALYLKRMSMQHTDLLGIIGKNTTYIRALTFACLMNATPFFPINADDTEENIVYKYGVCKPKIIFCDAAAYERTYNATKAWLPLLFTLDKKLEHVRYVEELLVPSDEEQNYYPALLVEGGTQTMGISCSSGTTGLSKAVCIQNKNFFFATRIISDDVLFALSSIAWLSGLATLVTSGLKGAKHVITTKPFTPEYFANIVHKHQITYFSTAPRIMAMLLDSIDLIGDKLKSLRIVKFGGSSCTDEMLRRMQELINAEGVLGNVYGTTEFGVVTSNYTNRKMKSPGLLGVGVRARIVSEDGRFLGTNENGELLIHLGREWSGYYNNAEATAAFKTPDNWLRTGDIAHFDDEGYLFIGDRKRDTLKCDSEHYWPTEIENIIAELPDVIEACVIGIYDEHRDHVPAALVRKLPNSPLTTEDIKQHVARRCPFYKHLDAGVVFTDALPQNKNAKVLRDEAKVLFERLIKNEK